MKGASKSAIKVRLIGGKEFDVYQASPDFSNHNKLYVYDQKTDSLNQFSLGMDVKYKLSNDTSVNNYQYDQFVYDRKGVVLDVNYGVDRGLILGLGYMWQNQGFRKKPFAYKHQLMGYYLTGRKSFMFDYEGIIKEAVSNNDLWLQLSSFGPKNLSNFFGYGNNTQYLKGEDDLLDKDYGIDYYRSRYDMASANIYLQNQLNDHIRYYYGSSTDFYYSNRDANEERFLEDFHQVNPDEFIYRTKFFTGLTVGAGYDTRDRVDLPQSGLYLRTDWSWRHELGGEQQQFVKSSNSLSGYKTVFGDRLTFANRIGVEAVWGDPYFYQHIQIGGENSMRGFNSRRFTGKTAVYNNFDLRVKLFDFNSYLVPGTIGAIGFYDVGRVWMTSEKSNTWHNGYGGGFYIMPADLFVIQAVVGVSNEAVLPYIRVGLSF